MNLETQPDLREDFQYVIRDISQAMADEEPITLDEDQVQALMTGFLSMSETIQTATEYIEKVETELEEAQSKKRKLWRP